VKKVLPVQFAAAGMLLMQLSVAVTLLGTSARIALLVSGLVLIGMSATRSIRTIGNAAATRVLLIIMCGAAVFELLSWFNAHNVFELKLVAFRLICYILLVSGILVGIATPKSMHMSEPSALITAMVVLIGFAAPITWVSLDAILVGEGVRGSFDESSPVALGFSSGALAVASLAIAFWSSRGFDYVAGSLGFAGWLAICLQSGSRGALFSLIVASLILSALRLRYEPKRVLALLLLAVALISGRIALGDSIATQASYVFERFESVLSLEADASIAGGAYSRALAVESNLGLPGLLLLGGEGYDPTDYPHNFEVEAIVRLGAPLATMFVGGVLYLLVKMMLILGARETNLGVVIVFVMGIFAFFNAQTNLMWEFLRPLWLALGVSYGVSLGCGKVLRIKC
jgi:hypothetical protein